MADIDDERDWHQEYKDGLAMGSPQEEPDPEPPLDLDDVARHYHEALAEDMTVIPPHSAEALAAVPELLARLRSAEEELAEWRGREHRYEHAISEGPEPGPGVRHRLVTCEAADMARDHLPKYGTPWVRVITTSRWYRHEAAPF